MNNFFEDGNWDDDFGYNPYDDELPPLEDWLNNPANQEWEKTANLSDSVIELIKTEDKMTSFLLRTLLLYFNNDYTKARKFISTFFKRLYLEEEQDKKTDEIMDEIMKPVTDENKLDNLLLDMEQIPEEVEESPLDGIDTIDDLLDKFNNNPDEKE